MQASFTVLGSGTSLSSFYQPFDFRHEAGHLLQFGDKKILFDCGEGMRERLDRIRVDFFTIDAICITHFHPDHCTLIPLIQSLYVRNNREKKEKTLHIYGPKTIGERTETMWNLTHPENSFQNDVLAAVNIVFHEYENGTAFDVCGVTVTPMCVAHGKMDAYALRAEIEGEIVTYSGDSGVCDSLADAAKDADLFFCEAARSIHDEKEDAAHLSPQSAAEIAVKAGVKKLIFVHYHGKDTPEEMRAAAKEAGFGGEIVVAKDYDVFTVG